MEGAARTHLTLEDELAPHQGREPPTDGQAQARAPVSPRRRGIRLGEGLEEMVLLVSGVVPTLPVRLSVPYIIAAELVSVAIGLIAGVAPATHAARLDPLEALRAE